jgi:hypothetical protein
MHRYLAPGISGDTMRRMILALLATAMLSACSGITIGPVDTSCHVNPARGDGSGCSEHGH